jgi:putative membrane protein
LIPLSDKKALILIGGISAAALAFLIWLIYFAVPAATVPAWASYLPTLNACLNASSTVAMSLGVWAIRRGRRSLHIRCMLTALASSTLFLLSYIAYHHLHGDTKYLGTGWLRPLYFVILISHIALSAVVLPMLLSTVFFASTQRFEQHKRLAKKTYPVWLYVSVTGVIVYLFLRVYY